ncbi:hypothetical protein [Archangium primigenium]|uniref:hypothetical protein n=1 Tax=[Archangium] primigenium TaxID=2792470 RepID=UPI001959FCC7|nr:hypothetical protein [Archangium primigenium]MBM7113142.1 hypothetical protein [Archangium primigenium]
MRCSSSFSSSTTVRVSSSSSCTKTPPKAPVCTKPSAPAPAPAPGKGHGGGSVFEPSKPSAPSASDKVRAQAVSQMDALLNEQANRKQGYNGAVVVQDAFNVERSTNTNPKSSRYKAAQAQVKSHEALEQQQLARLSPQERARYATVRQELAAANNPVATLALQKLLVSGRLEKGSDFLNEGSVLQHLSDIAQGNDIERRVDRQTLLTDLVQELATPSAINQGARGTCAPTAMTIGLNIERPAEYARLIKAAASTSGNVKLANGTTLPREKDTAFKDDGSGRALTQRLLAPIFMEASNGDRDYRDSASKENRNAGATARGLDALYDAVYDHNMSYDTNTKDRAKLMDRIRSELAEGQNVLAGIKYRNGGHQLLVTGLEKSQGKEYVKYINPWGQEERMAVAEFQSRMNGINYDTRPAKTLIQENRAFLAA